jgi:type II secretory pathway pseudopilin PulG
MSNRRAITRVEIALLLFGAVLLALVMKPSVHNADERARQSRVLNDFRSITAALEAYKIDHGEYPRNTWGDPPYNDRYTGMGRVNERVFGNLGPWISTPVAYTTNADFVDPYMRGRPERVDGLRYTYGSLKTLTYLSKEFDAYPAANLKLIEERFGEYFLLSYGPDKSGGGAGELFFIVYDPTNGAESFGNIISGQKQGASPNIDYR